MGSSLSFLIPAATVCHPLSKSWFYCTVYSILQKIRPIVRINGARRGLLRCTFGFLAQVRKGNQNQFDSSPHDILPPHLVFPPSKKPFFFFIFVIVSFFCCFIQPPPPPPPYTPLAALLELTIHWLPQPKG
jgi:hypothetical protein